MQVTLLHPHPVFGAVEAYVRDLATGLSERGHRVRLLYPDSPELQPLLQLASRGVEVSPFPIGSLRQHGAAVLVQLVAHLRGAPSTLVHVTEWWPLGILAARLAGRRPIVTHHTPGLPRRDNWKGRSAAALARLTRPAIIFTSEADRWQFSGELGSPSISIPLGIDLERFAAGPDASSVRRSERWSGSSPVIGNVGRLAEQKGQRHLLGAAPSVLAAYPRALFVIVGEGAMRGELERLAASLGVDGAFQFLGHREDVPALLRAFDLFVLPSLFEGLCYAILEAQAVGIPVVATAVGGVRDTVVPGRTGYLVPPGDPMALAQAILRALAEPDRALEMARRGQARVRRDFALGSMVDRTAEVYAHVAEGRWGFAQLA